MTTDWETVRFTYVPRHAIRRMYPWKGFQLTNRQIDGLWRNAYAYATHDGLMWVGRTKTAFRAATYLYKVKAWLQNPLRAPALSTPDPQPESAQ